MPVTDEVRSAEAWLVRLQAPDCTQAEREAFEQWRAVDPSRSHDFALAEHIHCQASVLASDPMLAMSAKMAHRRTAKRAQRNQLVRRLALPVAAAASLVIAIGHFRNENDSVTIQHFVTATGQLRALQLSDGTKVVLDTASTMTVSYSTKTRDVTLEEGRANFDVAHNATRPFIVHAGGAVIHDIGTRFQVCDQDNSATVTLLEGEITVNLPKAGWQSTLRPGQEVSFRSNGPGIVRNIDVADALSWTHGDLVFKDRNLAGLLDEMNRYSQVKVVLGDTSLRNLPVSGVFHAGDQVSLVQALQNGWSIQAAHVSRDEIVLYARPR
jgi:transmembrane sensor